jgi:hypothetical protein
VFSLQPNHCKRIDRNLQSKILLLWSNDRIDIREKAWTTRTTSHLNDSQKKSRRISSQFSRSSYKMSPQTNRKNSLRSTKMASHNCSPSFMKTEGSLSINRQTECLVFREGATSAVPVGASGTESWDLAIHLEPSFVPIYDHLWGFGPAESVLGLLRNRIFEEVEREHKRQREQVRLLDPERTISHHLRKAKTIRALLPSTWLRVPQERFRKRWPLFHNRQIHREWRLSSVLTSHPRRNQLPDHSNWKESVYYQAILKRYH